MEKKYKNDIVKAALEGSIESQKYGKNSPAAFLHEI